MAWDADRNRIYHQRVRDWAVNILNAAEEAARLRLIHVQQLQSDPAAYANTDIATKAEINTAQSFLTTFLKFARGLSGGAAANEDMDADLDRLTAWLLPLIDRDPA